MSYRQKLILLSAGFGLLLILAYSNHFNNGFYFDDGHTITSNNYITDISNIPLFFTDIATFGTMPDNRAYRPVVTTLNAIDYWIAGGYDSTYFHISIFFWYIVQGVVMFFLFQLLFNKVRPTPFTSIISIFGVAFYMLHTANAETINYIIMRSDSFSTLCILASLALFVHKPTRKYFLYLIPAIIGIGTKESGLMVVALIMLYVLLFEENWSVTEVMRASGLKKIGNALRKTIFPSLLLIAFFAFTRSYFMPKSQMFAGHPYDPFYYFITQWYVIATYIGNFVLPLDLSVDKDFDIIKTVFDQRVLFSLMLILTLVTIAFYCTTKKHLVPIAFGILWFFIALAPTSSFKPFGQIANDHRTFFPYIGFIISLTWTAILIYQNYFSTINSRKTLRYALPTFACLIIGLHAFGTFQRNKVWSNSESLWYDATIKAPNNGRALMNYGLSKMAKGEYEEALDYFTRAHKFMPYWAYININLGVLKNAMGKPDEAEQFYKNAINYQPLVPDGYYYYASFLEKQNRIPEAIQQLQEGLKISPGYTEISQYLAALKAKTTEDPKEKARLLASSVGKNPNANQLLNLSLAYYRAQMFEECIEACKRAIELDPEFPEAFNNMCSAYNHLKEWKKAEEACNEAIRLKPDFDRAKNNLRWAQGNL